MSYVAATLVPALQQVTRTLTNQSSDDPLDGSSAVIRVDLARGFVSLMNTNALQHPGVSIEVGRVKNPNKNFVAEKAIQERETEVLRQEPGGDHVTDLGLAVATARLNSRLRSQGLSARELWTQRNQFTNEQIPASDMQHIIAKHNNRKINHPYSEKAKGGRNLVDPVTPPQVGDLVYVKSDRDKTRVRDHYIIVRIDGEWCSIKKFTGSQLRATSYKVKLSECYSVRTSVPPAERLSITPSNYDEDCAMTPAPLPAPPELLWPHSPDPSDSSPYQAEHPSPEFVPDETAHTHLPASTSASLPLTSSDSAVTDTSEPPPQRTRTSLFSEHCVDPPDCIVYILLFEANVR